MTMTFILPSRTTLPPAWPDDYIGADPAYVAVAGLSATSASVVRAGRAFNRQNDGRTAAHWHGYG